jgi:hypothetical protein
MGHEQWGETHQHRLKTQFPERLYGQLKQKLMVDVGFKMMPGREIAEACCGEGPPRAELPQTNAGKICSVVCIQYDLQQNISQICVT